MNEANTLADVIGHDNVRPETVDEASARLNLTAPRVTPADLEANIAAEYFLNGSEATLGCPQHESLRLLTICILVCRNGFVIIGHSAPASPENYREELGRRYAKENAVRQLWPLMGYNLRDRIHRDDLYRKYEYQGHARPEDEARQLLGWLSGDIPELRGVEVPLLHASLERFRARQAEPRPEVGDGEVAPPPFEGFPSGHPGNPT